MLKLKANLDRILDTLSTLCLIGACISAVLMLVNSIAGRWNELMQIVPMSDEFINDIVDTLSFVMPFVIVAWGFRVWWIAVEKLKEKRDREEIWRV